MTFDVLEAVAMLKPITRCQIRFVILCIFILLVLLLQVESDNKVLQVYSLDAEFSRPLWVFGINSYELIQSHEGKNLVACSYR